MGNKILGYLLLAGGALVGLGGGASVVTHLMHMAARELEADAAARHAGGLLGALLLVALAYFAVRGGWRRLLPTGDDARVGVRSRITWIGVAAALALLVVGGRVNADREHAQLRVAAAELQRTLAVFQQAGSSLTAPDIGGSTPVAKGEAGKLEALVKSVLARTASQQREYRAALDAIGWSGVLDASRLQADPALVRTRPMIQRAREALVEYRAKADASVDLARRDIEAADLKPSTRRAVMEQFDKGLSQNRARAAATWSLEERILVQVEETVEWLAARKGAWQARDGKFSFRRQVDLDQFNARIAGISDLTGQQRQLALDATRRASDRVANMGR